MINCGDYEISGWAQVFTKRIFHKDQILQTKGKKSLVKE